MPGEAADDETVGDGRSEAPPRYLLDANVFIEANRRYFPRDVVPGFWDALQIACRAGRAFSIDSVRDELEAGDPEDGVRQWVDGLSRKEADQFFLPRLTPEAGYTFGLLTAWVEEREKPDGAPYYKQSVREEFAATADGWLVAAAASRNLTLVSHESKGDATKWKVPIPSLCQQVDVRQIDTFTMLRELGVRLVLADDANVAFDAT